MLIKFAFKIRITAFVALCFLVGVPVAFAAANFSLYHSPSGTFELQFPEDRTVKSTSLRLSPTTVAHSETLISKNDNELIKNAGSTYLFKMNHTIGPGFTPKQVDHLLKQAVENLTYFYQKKDAVILDQRDGNAGQIKTKEVDLMYNHPDSGPMALKAVIGIGHTLTFTQVMTGTESATQSFLGSTFFNSLKGNDGLTLTEGDIREEWDQHTSNLNMYTVLLPPVAPPFVTEPPSIETIDGQERLTFKVFDPVRKENLRYRVYTYVFDEPLSYETAEDSIWSKHVVRYLSVPEGVSIKRRPSRSYSTLYTQFNIPKSKAWPYPGAVKIQAQFAQNYMIVQEMVSSRAIINADFAKNLFRYIEFQPEQGHRHVQSQILQENKPH